MAIADRHEIGHGGRADRLRQGQLRVTGQSFQLGADQRAIIANRMALTGLCGGTLPSRRESPNMKKIPLKSLYALHDAKAAQRQPGLGKMRGNAVRERQGQLSAAAADIDSISPVPNILPLAH